MIKYEIEHKIGNCVKIESVTSHDLYPLSPVTNCHTFTDPSPLERDILYGLPLCKGQVQKLAIIKSSNQMLIVRLCQCCYVAHYVNPWFELYYFSSVKCSITAQVSAK